MPTNHEILRSVIKTTDQGTPGAGLLSPEQFMAFYEVAEERIPWMQLQNLEKRTAHTGGVPRIDYGDDVIRAATEAVDTGHFSKPTHDNVPYTMVKGRVAFKVSTEGLSQSADPNYQSKLINGFTRAWGRAFQQIGWNGDTTSLDPMLSLNNGWVVQMVASGNVTVGSTINAGVIDIDHFHAALQALPEAWQQRTDSLRWAMTRKKFNQYSQSISNRATGMGDTAISRGADGNPEILGMPVTAVPSLTETTDLDKVVLADPGNTTVVMDPRTFRLRPVTEGITVVAEDVIAYIGFFHSDWILLEPEGTSIVTTLDN